MIKWEKKEIGKYESEDGRFVVKKVSQRGLGPWQLIDRNVKKKYRMALNRDTMAECREYAECLVRLQA